MAGELTLTVAEYDGPARWRWTLADAGGAVIGDHTVIVDPGCWQFRALTGLDDYLRWHAAPDDPFPSQARIVADVGRWAGEQLFGSIGPELTARSPVTVRVVVPHQARAVAFLPLESAVVAGRPLALQRVSLVIQVDTERAVAARAKDPVSGRLRILALFSLPEGASALNLRRERYGLARLVEEIAATNNKAIELKVLQYGVTRQRLRSVVEQAEGWDVLHLSGHGLAGGLLLEQEDGTRDLVGTEDLVELLSPLVDRVKLVTASACSTAAVTATEQLRLLGLRPADADPFLQGVVSDMNRSGITPGSLIGPGMAAIGPAYMAFWDPALAALKTAGQAPPDANVNGDEDPTPEAMAAELFEVALAEADGFTVGAPLSAALRRVAAGERAPRDLVRGLDPLDTAIVLRALAVLAGTITLPDQLWLVVPVRGMIMGVICAAAGFQSPASAGLGQYLAVLDANAESAPLARVLRQILAGTRDASLLTRDLDPVQRAMVTTILTHLNDVAATTR